MLDETKVKKRVNVAGGVIVKQGDRGEYSVLLIRRAPDDHFPLMEEVPRGKCNFGPNEKIIPCLKREVKEETGLDVIPIKFIDKFSYLADKGTRLSTQYNFICKMKDQNQKVKLSNEHDTYKWISTTGEAELSVMPEMKKTLAKAFNMLNNIEIVNYDSDTNFKEDEIIEEYLSLL